MIIYVWDRLILARNGALAYIYIYIYSLLAYIAKINLLKILILKEDLMFQEKTSKILDIFKN